MPGIFRPLSHQVHACHFFKCSVSFGMVPIPAMHGQEWFLYPQSMAMNQSHRLGYTGMNRVDCLTIGAY